MLTNAEYDELDFRGLQIADRNGNIVVLRITVEKLRELLYALGEYHDQG